MQGSYPSRDANYGYMQNNQPHPYKMSRSGSRGSESRLPYQSSDYMNKVEKYMGTNQNLNYESNQLNRDNKSAYEQYYSANQAMPMSFKNSGKYMSQGSDRQMSQYPRRMEMYTDSRYSQGRDQVSMRNSMGSYQKMNDYNNVLM